MLQDSWASLCSSGADAGWGAWQPRGYHHANYSVKEWESSTSGPVAPCSRAAAVREVKAAARAELAARDGRARELAAERNAALALAQQHAQQVQARVGCLTAAQQQLSMRSAGNYARVCLSVLAWCPRRWGPGKHVCATLPTPAVASLSSST